MWLLLSVLKAQISVCVGNPTIPPRDIDPMLIMLVIIYILHVLLGIYSIHVGYVFLIYLSNIQYTSYLVLDKNIMTKTMALIHGLK